ncbi:MAG: hypothetical protein KF897_06885 [Opitutaceae bacterium]|nr:hypothetical protein [Opitutaceae bacterium]
MNSPVHIDLEQYPPRVRWFMAIVWAVILVKCVVIWWAMVHWSVPLHPLWIVAPTLVFAATATAIWLTHRRED